MKQIIITGTSNKYQMKQVLKIPKIEKRRIVSADWDFQDMSYSKHINVFENNLNDLNFYNTCISQIKTKLTNYKQQDILKNRLDDIIKIETVIEKLKECNFKCTYCSNEILILYELCREKYQWTLDRIDNSKGHNEHNILISCLECNLKKKKQNPAAFLFTKNLKIIKL